MNAALGSLLVSLALGLSGAGPVVVPGSICAAPNGLRVGDQAYFAPTCAPAAYADSGAVYFRYNSSSLDASARLALQAIGGRIMADTFVYFVDGHTDARGRDAYNFHLSLKRANIVRDALTAMGVSPARLVARGFGKEKPVAASNTAVGRARNRRVEVVRATP